MKYADIASGVYDDLLDQLMRRIAAWSTANRQKRVFMSFNAEPENEVPESGTAQEWVGAYRRVYDRAVAHHVRGALIFVWAMAGYKTRVHQWNSLYPGDEFVDWLGYDPYAGLTSSRGRSASRSC